MWVLVGEGVSWNLITIWICSSLPPIAMKLVPGKGGGLEDWKIIEISKGMMFRFYVSFPGCNRSALNKKQTSCLFQSFHWSTHLSMWVFFSKSLVTIHCTAGWSIKMTIWLVVSTRLKNTVDGRNPAPVDMVNISLFTRFHACWVVEDFYHQQYESNWIISPGIPR